MYGKMTSNLNEMINIDMITDMYCEDLQETEKKNNTNVCQYEDSNQLFGLLGCRQ